MEWIRNPPVKREWGTEEPTEMVPGCLESNLSAGAMARPYQRMDHAFFNQFACKALGNRLRLPRRHGNQRWVGTIYEIVKFC